MSNDRVGGYTPKSYTVKSAEGKRHLIKDSGKRKEFSSGMHRDVTDDKINWTLVADGPMLRRWAEHMTGGALKYDDRNWMKASGREELQRFKESAFRHFMQWYYEEDDEDHASAVYFNINGVEYCKSRMGDTNPQSDPPTSGGA